MDDFTNLINQLGSLEGRIKNSIKEAVKINALEAEQKAKLLCPVDTGHLRRSISTEINETTDKILVDVLTNVEYGSYVEYGTSRQPAQPFMKPAYESQKVQFERDISETVRRELGR